jgi:hypothetical protein
VKIFQTYYAPQHEPHLIEGLIPLNTSHVTKDRLEYDIFKELRSEGDFGVVSWKFGKKTCLVDWQDRVHEKLKSHDAVIINPFPAIEALVWNCWENQPNLIPMAGVDTDVMQKDVAFCSYIVAKRNWWDAYFSFVDGQLTNLHPDAFKPAGYFRAPWLNSVPFLIERWLNHCLNGSYMWEYDSNHFQRKYGDASLCGLKEKKGTEQWVVEKSRFHFPRIASLDDPD